MKRRILSIISIVVCLSVFTLAGMAATTTAEGDWIDRLTSAQASGTLPDYATGLYNWLVAQSGTDGALVTVSGTDVEQVNTTVNGTALDFAGYPVATNSVTTTETSVPAELSTWITTVQNMSLDVVNAFRYDYPEVFWLNGTAKVQTLISGSSSDGVNWTFTADVYLVLSGTMDDGEYDIRDTATYPDIAASITARDSAINTIKTAVGDAATDYDKLAAINGWLTKNNEYNTLTSAGGDEPDSAHDCLSALTGSTGENGPVCEGYAKAFKIMCDQYGIPCVLISGTGTNSSGNSEAHMWNAVLLDGKWYGVDVTWNDPTGGASGAVSGYERADYLLVGSNTLIPAETGKAFSVSHEEIVKVNFSAAPALSTTAYVPATPIAEVTVNGVTTQYTDLQTAFDNSAGGTVKLLADVTLVDDPDTADIYEDYINLEVLWDENDENRIPVAYILDLNGKTLSSAASALIWLDWDSVTLTVTDSVGGGAIKSTALDGLAIYSNGTVIIEGGTLSGTPVDEDTPARAIFIDASSGGALTINGGTVNGLYILSATIADITVPIGKALYLDGVQVTDLTVGELYGAVTIGDCKPHSIGSDGKCTICGTQMVAAVTIGDITTYYTDFSTAITATNNQTAMIKLLADVTGSYTFSSGTVTLDLNGKAITNNSSDALVVKNQLIIKDSIGGGAVTAKTAINVQSTGTLILQGGTLNGTALDIYFAGASPTPMTVNTALVSPVSIEMNTPGVFAQAGTGVTLETGWFTSYDENYLVVTDDSGQTLALKKDISKCTVTVAPATYTGAAQQTFTITVTDTDGTTTLTEGTDYTYSTVEGADLINVGTKAGVINIDGKGNYGGSIAADFTINPAAAVGNVTVTAVDVTYDGTAQTTAVTVIGIGGEAISADDYAVTYADNTNAGTASVAVAFKGTANYTGSVTGNFSIAQRPVTITPNDQTVIRYGEIKPDAYTVIGLADGHQIAVTLQANTTAEPGSEAYITVDSVTITAADTSDVTDNYVLTTNKGALTIRAHEHSWSYAADDENDIITATCSGAGQCNYNNEVKISPEIEDSPYDGAVKTVTVSCNMDGALGSLAAPTISYTGDCKNAGTHTVTLTCGGVSVSRTFVITQLEAAVTPANASKIYGEADPALTYTVSGVLTGETLIGSLSRDPGEDVGEYAITLGDLAEKNPNYSIAFASGASLSIQPADVSKVTVTAADGGTYDGTAKTPAVTVAGIGGEAISADDYTVTYANNTNAGTATATITFKDTANYTGSAEANFRIAPAALTVKADDVTVVVGTAAPTSYTYTVTGLIGSDKLTVEPTLAVSGTVDTSKEGSYTITCTGAAEAGNYTVTYVNGTLSVVVHEHVWRNASVNRNILTATCSNTVTNCTIADKTLTVTLSAPTALNYDGTAKAATVTVAPAGAITTGTITYSAEPINAGKYTASVTVLNKTLTVDFEIVKQAPTYTAPSCLTAAYGDTLAKVTLPTVANGTWAWNDTAIKVGNVGTKAAYKATFTPTDTVNYGNVTVDLEVEVTTKAAAPALKDVEQTALYTVTELTAAISGMPADAGTLTYTKGKASIADDAWSIDTAGKLTATIADGKPGDKFTFTATISSQNYSDAAVNVVVTLVNKAAQNAPAAFALTFTMNTDGKTFTAAIPAVNGALYSFDGVNFSAVNTKTDCEPTTAYTGYMKLAETDTLLESAVTAATATSPSLIIDENFAHYSRVESFVLDAVPASIAHLYPTVETMTEQMMRVAIEENEGFSTEHSVCFDVKLQFSIDGKTWIDATEANFPEEGITVLLDSPVSNPEKYDFLVVHMFTTTSARLGTTAGEVEVLVPAVTEEGLEVTLKGLSPVTVMWNLKQSQSSSDPSLWLYVLLKRYNTDYAITADAAEGGTISDAGVSLVKYKRDKTYTIIPAEGYAIEAVLVDGVDVGAVETYTFDNVTDHHSITAVFKKTAWTNPYADVAETAPFYADVEFVTEQGLMDGTAEATFAPDTAATRADLITALWRLEGSPIVESHVDFFDVTADAWYAEAVYWAEVNGIAGGYGDGTFGPLAAFTHEQAAVILWRYAKFTGKDVSVGENTNILSYTDAFSISEYAIPAYQWACGAGVIDCFEDGSLRPCADAARSWIAHMLRSYLDDQKIG